MGSAVGELFCSDCYVGLGGVCMLGYCGCGAAAAVVGLVVFLG